EAKAEFAYTKGTRIRDALAEIALDHRTHVTYPSYRIAEDGTLRNSIEFLGRDGDVGAVYDKIVPTPNERAGMGVQPGEGVLAADLDFGRVSAAICFDLNFEPVRAAVARVQPELIVFPSAYHGGLMQNYWALSCRSYFVSCVNPPNRSAIIDPTGHEVASTSPYDWLLTRTVNLDYALAHLDRHREKLLHLKAQYGREVMIEDPGLVGMVLVSSQSDEVSAVDMLREFEIQELDGYFAESTAHLEHSTLNVLPAGGAS
ncbi:MAG: carbon-nitrogen hydrolase family protein, partial [Brachybacterium sp.]